MADPAKGERMALSSADIGPPPGEAVLSFGLLYCLSWGAFRFGAGATTPSAPGVTRIPAQWASPMLDKSPTS